MTEIIPPTIPTVHDNRFEVILVRSSRTPGKLVHSGLDHGAAYDVACAQMDACPPGVTEIRMVRTDYWGQAHISGRLTPRHDRHTGLRFEGMAYVDATPLPVDDRDVSPMGADGVPALVRDHARVVLTRLSGEGWWTVGEARQVGGTDFDTITARRVQREGRVVVEYGVETTD